MTFCDNLLKSFSENLKQLTINQFSMHFLLFLANFHEKILSKAIANFI